MSLIQLKCYQLESSDSTDLATFLAEGQELKLITGDNLLQQLHSLLRTAQTDQNQLVIVLNDLDFSRDQPAINNSNYDNSYWGLTQSGLFFSDQEASSRLLKVDNESQKIGLIFREDWDYESLLKLTSISKIWQALLHYRQQAENLGDWLPARKTIDQSRFLLASGLIKAEIVPMVNFLDEWYIINWWGNPQSERIQLSQNLARLINYWIGQDIDRFNHIIVSNHSIINNLTSSSIDLYRDVKINWRSTIKPHIYIIVYELDCQASASAVRFLEEKRQVMQAIGTSRMLRLDPEAYAILSVIGPLTDHNQSILQPHFDMIIRHPPSNKSVRSHTSLNRTTHFILRALRTVKYQFLVRVLNGQPLQPSILKNLGRNRVTPSQPFVTPPQPFVTPPQPFVTPSQPFVTPPQPFVTADMVMVEK